MVDLFDFCLSIILLSYQFYFLFLSDVGRRGQYVVTRDVDVNSIFEGMDMSMFDKRSSQRWGVY